jgi:hypothetical protein
LSKFKIKLFRDGRFLGLRHRSTIEALAARGLVSLERNAKGYVVAAHEQRLAAEISIDSARPSDTRASVLRPTRYSFEDASLMGRPWDLRRLGGTRQGIRYAPVELRGIFLGVVLDCLV